MLAGGGLLALAGCAGDDSSSPRVASTVRSQGHYKVGSPYTINGVTYYPEEDYSYDRTGEASWYGPGFHGRLTANGEIFDQNEMTAAHTTLQLPSLVRVTNLENGRSAVLRVNDRGPFRYNRVIDVSRQAAEALGFLQQGHARVRVQVLPEESRQVAEAARRGEVVAPPGGPVLASLPDAPPPAAAPSVVTAGPLPGTAPLPPLPEVVPGAFAPEPVPAAAPQPPMPPLDTVALLAVSSGAAVTPLITGPEQAGGAIYVQAGTFVDLENAVMLRDRLGAFGPATVVSTNVDGVRFHRVRIGPLASMAEADGLLANVQRAGQPAARIVVENPAPRA